MSYSNSEPKQRHIPPRRAPLASLHALPLLSLSTPAPAREELRSAAAGSSPCSHTPPLLSLSTAASALLLSPPSLSTAPLLLLSLDSLVVGEEKPGYGGRRQGRAQICHRPPPRRAPLDSRPSASVHRLAVVEPTTTSTFHLRHRPERTFFLRLDSAGRQNKASVVLR